MYFSPPRRCCEQLYIVSAVHLPSVVKSSLGVIVLMSSLLSGCRFFPFLEGLEIQKCQESIMSPVKAASPAPLLYMTAGYE